ncbi:MAG TPA: RNA pyrophosphohydrolase [Phenylobacterium sp.]|jgi:putative (di)nucleoside polyphosphate hydrolase|uniref:RNA pyrophosphohydrolase n=1 Tax=Phenylobacterium sp. TaxID=1871053 RepID=UPI002D312696|nr:RNA pyrophosphohydrolase [Phenylobacterium sp.]HZZ69257.1 RNA pyrophosphohydrolase [Phenylobacterium sp.]
MTQDLELYRPNVGVVLFHPDGRVWLGRRANTPGPHNWQFPQGGVDPGEELEAAARRELNEETGAIRATFLGRTEDWVAYDFPAGHGGSKALRGWKGQKQVWFAFRFDGEDTDFDLTAHGPPEFDAWRWALLAEAAELIVPFKQAAYQRVVEAFSDFAAAPGRG